MKRVFWVSLLIFAFVATAWGNEAQKELCLSVIEQIYSIDREVSKEANLLRDAIGRKDPKLIGYAQNAMNAAEKARNAFGRVQMDMPDGMPSDVESSLNDAAYEMKTAYGLSFVMYKNFASALEKDPSAKMDISTTGQAYQHIMNAVLAMEQAKSLMGLQENGS